MLKAEGIDSLLLESSRLLLESGELIENKRTGSEILEVLGYSAICSEPRDRIIRNPNRKNNIVAQIAETIWIMMGSSEIKYIEDFLPRAKDFSDNGKNWRAGYGPRIRGYEIGVNEEFYCQEKGTPESLELGAKFDQLYNVYSILSEDPSSRQAYMVVPIMGDNFIENLTLDTPCTLAVQFLIRGGRLHCLVTMRSNDMIWGQTGINFFEWTFLQEILASLLKVEVGNYYHFVGSYHSYRKHFNRIEKILEYNQTEFEENRHLNLDVKEFFYLFKSLNEYRKVFDFIKSLNQENIGIEKFLNIIENLHALLSKEISLEFLTYLYVPIYQLSYIKANKKSRELFLEHYKNLFLEKVPNFKESYLLESLIKSNSFLKH